jgi:hypothetical protein
VVVGATSREHALARTLYRRSLPPTLIDVVLSGLNPRKAVCLKRWSKNAFTISFRAAVCRFAVWVATLPRSKNRRRCYQQDGEPGGLR